MLGWAVAALAVVIGGVAVYLALSPGPERVATTVTTTTTEGMTDLEVIEAGVAAYYSGDGDRAAELFELSGFDDDQIRAQAAYQAAVGGRLTLTCSEKSQAGDFICQMPYHSALTDAISLRDSGDTNDVSVRDGVIVDFTFPEHTWILHGIGIYLAVDGRLQGYEECLFGGVYPPSCAALQIENVQRWNDWRRDMDPPAVIRLALESWYGGDCWTALLISASDGTFGQGTCSSETDSKALTMEYESILGAEVSTEGCVADSDQWSCEVHYSNAMNVAVGKSPAVTVKEFWVYEAFVFNFGTGTPWYGTDYPEDAELRESFTAFAEASDLAEEYATGNCASARTPQCATLIIDNLEAFATWYRSNG
jgi:hypothetical protein